MTRSLPVLMYHYISRFTNSIAVHPERFEAHLKGMNACGWRGIGLDEAEYYLAEGRALPKKSLLITFDDGFLDNYVYAWPLLQQYGHKGVIFAATGRLEAAAAPRPTLADVRAGTLKQEHLPRVDQPFVKHRLGFEERHDHFINWNEARLMEESGVMRIAAHSVQHHAVFAGPDFEGFHAPGHRGRTFDRVHGKVVWGTPRFKERPELFSRAFVPAPELVAAIGNLVPQDKAGAYAFFQDAERVAQFEKLIQNFKDAGTLGSYETDEARTARMQQVFATCKQQLEHELGHSVTSFCWPWGNHCEEALTLGKKAGFKVFFKTSMGANPPASPDRVNRFKVKDKDWNWLRLRLAIYSRPWAADLYARVRL